MKKRLEVITQDQTPPVWASLRAEATRAAAAEPGLASLLNAVVLSHEGLATPCPTSWPASSATRRSAP